VAKDTEDGVGTEPRGVSPEEQPLLRVDHVAKSFGPVKALIDGSVDLYRGESHALLGENGAGKSTLVKILAGVYQPDAGHVLLDGVPINLASPAAARDALTGAK